VLLIYIASLLHTSCGRMPESLIDQDFLRFANSTELFDFRVITDEYDNTVWSAWFVQNLTLPSRLFNRFYTELVLVESQEYADDFPDSTIVGWLREDRVPHVINNLHWSVSRTADELAATSWLGRSETIYLEDFGLAFPITRRNLIDDWEKVHALINALGWRERERFRWMNREYDPEVTERLTP